MIIAWFKTRGPRLDSESGINYPSTVGEWSHDPSAK